MSYQQNIEVPPAVWNTACSNLPYTLGSLTEQRPLLLVFLRHLGCTFCRQALADLKKYREDISGKGVHIGLVHMVEDAVSLPFSKNTAWPTCPASATRRRRCTTPSASSAPAGWR